MKASWLRPPNVPKPYNYNEWTVPGRNVDLLARPLTEKSPQPPFVPGIIQYMSSIAALQWKCMRHVEKHKDDAGSEEDLPIRREFYRELLEWRDKLPDFYRSENNFTPETCFLKWVSAPQMPPSGHMC